MESLPEIIGVNSIFAILFGGEMKNEWSTLKNLALVTDDRRSKQQLASSFLTSSSFPRSNLPGNKDQTRIQNRFFQSEGTDNKEEEEDEEEEEEMMMMMMTIRR